MKSRKMKLLSAAVGAMALIATLELARKVHNGAAPPDQAYGTTVVVGPNGEFIAVPADPSIRSELGRDGLPE
jgi:hypothetical protein